VKVYNRRFRTR